MSLSLEDRLEVVRTKRDELLSGGVEGYAIGSRNLRYALDHLREEERYLAAQIARAASGGGVALAVFNRAV